MPEPLAEETLFLHNAEIGLGTWSWGDRTMWNYGHGYSEPDIEQAFQSSVTAGINLMDTAEVYGGGRSERFLGQFIKTSPTPILVATKFMPYPWRLNRGALMHSLDLSLERLGLDHVDLYQIHWPFPPMPVEFWVEGLAKAVKSGKTRTAGVSNYNKIQMQRAYTILSKYNLPLASNQVEYHLLNRTVEKNGLLDRCKELGVRLIAYSPLAKGLLTGKYTLESPPPGMRSRQPMGRMKALPGLIALMTEIGKGHGDRIPSQVALNWLICKGALPIPGAKTAKQAEQNAGAKGWRLTLEEVKALDDASDKFTR
ncbi:MAG: aldo/keto reductase [Anaerolineales bacterium]|jgi:aryl-alcohol dehydrogenase-like predicted oxidoreductase